MAVRIPINFTAGNQRFVINGGIIGFPSDPIIAFYNPTDRQFYKAFVVVSARSSLFSGFDTLIVDLPGHIEINNVATERDGGASPFQQIRYNAWAPIQLRSSANCCVNYSGIPEIGIPPICLRRSYGSRYRTLTGTGHLFPRKLFEGDDPAPGCTKNFCAILHNNQDVIRYYVPRVDTANYRLEFRGTDRFMIIEGA